MHLSMFSVELVRFSKILLVGLLSFRRRKEAFHGIALSSKERARLAEAVAPIGWIGATLRRVRLACTRLGWEGVGAPVTRVSMNAPRLFAASSFCPPPKPRQSHRVVPAGSKSRPLPG